MRCGRLVRGHFLGVGGSLLESRPLSRPPVEKSEASEAGSREPPMGAGRGSAGVRSNVLTPRHKKKSTRTTTCSESAHVLCERALCTHDNWNKDTEICYTPT